MPPRRSHEQSNDFPIPAARDKPADRKTSPSAAQPQTSMPPSSAAWADSELHRPTTMTAISQCGGVLPVTALLQEDRFHQEAHENEGDQASPSRRVYFDPAREISPAEEFSSSSHINVNRNSPREEQDSTATTSSIRSRFKLEIVQQPIAARACGHGERDRRVVDPPPILQLKLQDFNPESSSDLAELQRSHNVVSCKLYTAGANLRDVSTITDPSDPKRVIRSLMGMASATAFIGIDPEVDISRPAEQRLGVFYIFHDISCRHTGRYRLYFEMASLSMDVGVTREVVASAMSDVFEVYSAKDFPGMRPSSALTHELKRQGAMLPIKKGVDGTRRDEIGVTKQ